MKTDTQANFDGKGSVMLLICYEEEAKKKKKKKKTSPCLIR
jgi:hypothetical protein